MTELLNKVKSIATTILSVAALTTMIGTSVMFLAQPWTKPYLEIPSRLESIEKTFEIYSKPQLVVFEGRGIIVEDRIYKAGEEVEVLYLLQRVASCDTETTVRLYDVDRGVYRVIDTRPVRKAPVSESLTNFKITFTIPENTPEGNYTYHPSFKPLECGVYGEYVPPHSDIIRIE